MVLPVVAWYLFGDNDEVMFWIMASAALFCAIALMSGSAKLHGGVSLFCGAFLILMIGIHHGV